MSAPDTIKCQVTVGASSASFAASGGTGTVDVLAARDCAWTASVSAAWISLSNTSSGQGDGRVTYVVAPNQTPSPRSGALVVAATTVQLNQAAASCVFTLSRNEVSMPATGGQATIDVATLAGCSWSASALDSWITVVAGQNGNGSGSVVVSVVANAGSARTGRVVIAGQNFAVVQVSGAGPSVHLAGTVSRLAGRCPNLQFVLGDTPVATDPSTDFRSKGGCGDMRNGANVTVDGLRVATGVRAQLIEFH